MIKAAKPTLSTQTAISRGSDFIYRVANEPRGFESYGSSMICCFALCGATSRDVKLRQRARARAQKLAQRWKRRHPVVPSDATTEQVLDFVIINYALSRLGLRDSERKSQIRAAVAQFSVDDLLGFNPLSDPPPNDLPYSCECGLNNVRGRKSCRKCKRRLAPQSSYRVWMEALANTYVSERCGLSFGAPYLDVLKWLPAMRPYPGEAGNSVEILHDAIYAVTHVVYTLNDYGTYRLSPSLLPQEFSFLKANVISTCERKDPEVLGELLDSLKAFGLGASHPLIKHGTDYLLAAQNEDGSWGKPEECISTRCHTTWTAIDGLRSYAWRGKRLLRPELKLMLSRMR